MTCSDEEKAYRAGYACGLTGPNTTNCHFAHFATRALTTEWERGKANAEQAKRTALTPGDV